MKAFTKREQLIQKLKSFPVEMKSLPSEVIGYLELVDAIINGNPLISCFPAPILPHKPILNGNNILLRDPLFGVSTSPNLGVTSQPFLKSFASASHLLQTSVRKSLRGSAASFAKTLLFIP